MQPEMDLETDVFEQQSAARRTSVWLGGRRFGFGFGFGFGFLTLARDKARGPWALCVCSQRDSSSLGSVPGPFFRGRWIPVAQAKSHRGGPEDNAG